MKKPVIDAIEALADIRAGLDDVDLMEKYNLSAKGLQSLFNKLDALGLLDRSAREGARGTRGPKAAGRVKEVSAKELLADFRGGLSDNELMRKHNLSAKELQGLFEQLLDAGLITESELEEQEQELDVTVDVREDLLPKGSQIPPSPERQRGDISPAAIIPPNRRPRILPEHDLVEERTARNGLPEGRSGRAEASAPQEKAPPSGREQEEKPIMPEPKPIALPRKRGVRERRNEFVAAPDLLKAELDAKAEELKAHLYPGLPMLGQWLCWFGIAQLVLVLAYCVVVAFALVSSPTGLSFPSALPTLVLPAIVSLAILLICLTLGQGIKIGVDISASLHANNLLLKKLLSRSSQEKGEQ